MEYSNHSTTFRLNLAPGLDSPLKIWNPLDYLRLLYWIFFFPQALQWYETRFVKSPTGNKQEANWHNRRQRLLIFVTKRPVQRNLFLQGQVLIIVVPPTHKNSLGMLSSRMHPHRQSAPNQ